MSGIFGIVDAQTDIEYFLNAARAKISHFPHYQSDLWVAPPVGLGRVGIGIFNPEPQPIRDGDLILFMSGELYHRDELAHRLTAKGYPPHTSAVYDLVFSAYRAFGENFAAELDGSFFIAILDQNQLIIANDRYGLYPHYYCYKAGKLAFGPEVKAVLCAPFVDRHKMNYTALAEYVRFQQLLGEKTFHEDIQVFPYASVARFDLRSAQWTIQRYWDWNRIQENPNVGLDESIIETGRLLRAAVEEMTTDDLRPAVFLSGGLDSRTLLGLIPARAEPPITASFGAPDSRDVYYASQIARRVGSRHHWFDLSDANWVLENVDTHLKLTEGFHSWIHMHGITMLPKLRSIADYNLSGWDGGTVLGDPDLLRPIFIEPVDMYTVLGETFRKFVQGYTWWGITEPDERMLYTPEFFKRIEGQAFESMAAEFKRFWDYRPNYALEYFYIVYHCCRLTQYMIVMQRSHLEVRCPFWDYRLIEFVYSLKPEIRADHHLYHGLITRETPALATIPYNKDEFWPTSSQWQRRIQSLTTRARKRLHLQPNRPTLYADYENYVRHELRGWVESIFTSSEQRGIFQPEFLRSLLARHMVEHEPWTIGKIAPLVTLEMMFRELFD